MNRKKPIGLKGKGKPPTDYKVVYTAKLTRAMDGSAPSVTWKTYLHHDPQTANPIKRTTVWLVGKIVNGTAFNKFNLFKVGAQHRVHDIFLRVADSPSSFRLERVENIRDGTGNVTGQRTTPAVQNADVNYPDFYTIDPSGKFAAGFSDIEYQMTSGSSRVTFEICFPDYAVGDQTAQLEDGGPPPGDPSDLL